MKTQHILAFIVLFALFACEPDSNNNNNDNPPPTPTLQARPVSILDTWGNLVSFNFDNNNRITSIVSSASGVEYGRSNFTYFNDSIVEQVTHEGQNNTKSVYALNQGRVIEANEYYRSTASDPYMLVLKTNYSYNGNGRVVTQRAEYESGQAEIVNYTYNTGLVRVTYSDENNGMPGAAYRVDSLKYSNNDLLTEGSLWFSDMDGYFMEGRTNFSYDAQNKLASMLADEWGTTEEFSVEWQGTTCSIYSEPAHDLEVTVEFADQTSNLALLQPEALLFSSAFPYWFTDMARF